MENILMDTTIKEKLLLIKPELIEKYKIKKIGIFGSFVDGTFTDKSDIDILVEFEETPGWEFFRLSRFLEKYFERKVDLVTPEAIKPQIKDRIFKQVVFV